MERLLRPRLQVSPEPSRDEGAPLNGETKPLPGDVLEWRHALTLRR